MMCQKKTMGMVLALALLSGDLGVRLVLGGAPVLIDRLDASVNSALVFHSDIDKFKRTVKLRTQLDPLFAGTLVATQGEKAAERDVVEFLINEKLISQQFPVNDAEVEQEINSIQTNNHVDRAGLKNALAEQGFTFEDYFDLIRISASKRNLIDRDIRTKVGITEDDVKNYFYNHFARTSTTPLAYHLQFISISTKTYKNAAAAKDAAIRALKELQKGDLFEEVAKRFSDGPTASSGGDLGVLTEDQMSPAIREQVKKLRIGQISGLFGSASSGGFYVIKLVDVKSGDSDRYEKVKDDIRNQLVAAEYQHQISLWIDRQRQAAFIHRAGEASTAGLPLSQP